MQPSPVACSDGITFDTTLPKLLSVSIANGRTGRAIACMTSNGTWLVNSNLTKVRLSSTTACLSACPASYLRVVVDHLELTSNASLGDDLSDDLCSRLPLMSSEHAIVLPSDYVRLQWAGRDEESHMEEFYVGMGAERTTASAPRSAALHPNTRPPLLPRASRRPESRAAVLRLLAGRQQGWAASAADVRARHHRRHTTWR